MSSLRNENGLCSVFQPICAACFASARRLQVRRCRSCQSSPCSYACPSVSSQARVQAPEHKTQMTQASCLQTMGRSLCFSQTSLLWLHIPAQIPIIQKSMVSCSSAKILEVTSGFVKAVLHSSLLLSCYPHATGTHKTKF